MSLTQRISFRFLIFTICFWCFLCFYRFDLRRSTDRCFTYRIGCRLSGCYTTVSRFDRGLLIFFSFGFCLPGRKVHFVDRSGRTYADTLPAQTAFAVIDISQIVFNGNSSEGTFLGTFSATDTSCFTSFPATPPLSLLTQETNTRRSFGPLLRNSMMFRGQAFTQAPQATHLSSSTTGNNVVESMCIGIERAGCNTVATSQTAESAGCIADI